MNSISINREVLCYLFSEAASMVSKKSPLSILQQAKVTLKGGLLTLEATDLENSLILSTKVNAEEEFEFSCCVEPKKISRVLKELDDEVVRIEIEKEKELSIKSSNSEYRFGVMSTEDFPSLPAVESSRSTVVQSSLLEDALREVIYAASRKEELLQAFLGGICFDFRGDQVVMVATDQCRLAAVKLQQETEKGSEEVYVLPLKAVLALMRLAKKAETITLRFSPKVVEAEFDDPVAHVRIITRTLEGKFPNWQAVVPETSEAQAKITVETVLLLDALRRLKQISGGEKAAVSLDIQDASSLILSFRDEEAEGKEILPIQAETDNLHVSVNLFFLIDLVSAIQTSNTTLEVYKGKIPLVVVRSGAAIHLLVPLVEQ